MSATAVMSVSGLTVAYGSRPVLDGVDLELVAGRVHVVLGASGSGKTTLLRALIGMVPAPGRVSARRLVLRDVDLSAPRAAAWRRVRGRHIGLIAQDPAQALTPLRRVASLVREADRLAGGAPDHAPHVDARVERVLRAAGFADPGAVASRYCFALSGGMAQRLGVGLAVAAHPAVLLADEPSTALDGIARARLAATLREVADAGAAVVLVTHDVALAAGLADDVTVLHDGRVVEAGPAADVLAAPGHEATRRLVDARRPRPAAPPAPRGPSDQPVLSVRGLRQRYRGTGLVLDGVDLDVADGEVVGLAGRSGAGKTTLLRCLVGLERPDGGELRIGGRTPAEAGWRAVRRAVQIVPQDPRAALNPWRTARELVADPLDAHRVGARAQRRARADELLERVGLDGLAHRRPGQLSTGQCQRVAIARALALRPRLLIADEPVTALDTPLRQGILDLLRDVVREHDMAAVVISHDLYVLEALCHRIAVLDAGRLVEDLPAAALRDRASHPLTRALIDCHPDCHQTR
ncbi:ABC transporter ATP-binding protein [Actinomycetes bacterium KLBMP 9797]